LGHSKLGKRGELKAGTDGRGENNLEQTKRARGFKDIVSSKKKSKNWGGQDFGGSSEREKFLTGIRSRTEGQGVVTVIGQKKNAKRKKKCVAHQRTRTLETCKTASSRKDPRKKR